jgi:glycosyltransferase involved in cell wall biosynthesis
VEFRGVISRRTVYEVLQTTALVLHTTRRVVFGLCLLETMAYATPVIVSDAKGNLEAVGVEYPLQASCEKCVIGEQGLNVISDSATLERLGGHLRERFLAFFRPSAMLQTYVSLWEDLHNRK